MRQSLAIVLTSVVLSLFAEALTVAQEPGPPSLKEQLTAQYKLAKVGAQSGQIVVKESGTVLVVQQAGIKGAPLVDLAVPTAVYRDGVLHSPSKASGLGRSLLQAGVNPTSDTSGKDFRAFPMGDKVYIYKLDVDAKNDKVQISIVECAECNGASDAYKAAVSFQFAKGYMASPDVPEVEDTIAKVLAIDTTPVATQPEAQTASPAPAQAEPGQGLTNDDIIKMVQIKLADAVIVAKIKSSTCAFDTSVDGLTKLKQAGVSDAVLQAMIEGGGQSAVPPTQPTAPSAETTAAPACADYNSCITSGSAAYANKQWDQALASLQKASALDPNKAFAWAEMGRVYLSTGQYQDAVTMWDKTLQLGGTLNFAVWHYKPSQYERGTFLLSSKEVTFAVRGQEKVFSVAPTDVSSVKSHHPPLARDAWSFGMKAGGHNYWFSYVPFGPQCENPIRCSDATGYSQEEAVSNYVAQTLEKIAPGSSGK